MSAQLSLEEKLARNMSYASQCFSIALVESMIVPSMSNKKPSKEARTGGAENDIAGEVEGTALFEAGRVFYRRRTAQ